MLAIANCYGNVDVRCPLSKRYVHVRGKRLQPLCKKLRIEYAPALVDFSGSNRRGYKPKLDGVVVSAQSAPRLLAEIEARKTRNPPEKRAKAAKCRAKRRREENDRMRKMGIDPDGRTARWLRRGDIDEDEAMLIAFKTAYRHEYTNYDDLVRNEERGDARLMAEEDEIPSDWETYLGKYGFPCDKIAEALSRVLRSPRQSHPVWFCEAILAVKRRELPLDSLTYEKTKEAIDTWRLERE